MIISEHLSTPEQPNAVMLFLYTNLLEHPMPDLGMGSTTVLKVEVHMSEGKRFVFIRRKVFRPETALQEASALWSEVETRQAGYHLYMLSEHGQTVPLRELIKDVLERFYPELLGDFERWLPTHVWVGLDMITGITPGE